MLNKLLSLFKTKNIVSIRGATTVIEDTKKDIEIRTSKLLQEIFSSTEDLKAYYPASVARKNFGLHNESLFSTTEPKIKNNLKLCIRTLIVFKSKIPQKNLKFIYLENAKNLRIQ